MNINRGFAKRIGAWGVFIPFQIQAVQTERWSLPSSVKFLESEETNNVNK